MSTVLIAWCVAILLSSLLGGLLPLATVLTHTRLQVYLSFSAGTMLGAAFLHMLPESAEHSRSAFLWCASGLLGLFLLERFFAYHHHEPTEKDHSDPCLEGHSHSLPTARDHHSHDHSSGHRHSQESEPKRSPESGTAASGRRDSRLQWGAAAIGLTVHTLLGGIALGSAFSIAPPGGLSWWSWLGLGTAAGGTALATLVHKPADSLTVVSLMLRAGLPRVVAHLVNLGFALLIPAGVLLFEGGVGGLAPENASVWTANALAFSSGTFLCIALSDLLPELQFHDHDRFKLSAALLAGFGLMALAQIGGTH